jgi:hypothetical protein
MTGYSGEGGVGNNKNARKQFIQERWTEWFP